MLRTPSPLGLIAVDQAGVVAGRIEGTVPHDGSDPEFAIVRLVRGRFAGARLVPLAGSRRNDCVLQFPVRYADIQEAPDTERTRWLYEQVAEARAYWPEPE
jgi:hypothetical protein